MLGKTVCIIKVPPAQFPCLTFVKDMNLPRLTLAMLNIHVRHCTAKSNILELLENCDMPKQKNVKGVPTNNTEKVNEDKAGSENSIKNILLNSSSKLAGPEKLTAMEQICKLKKITLQERVMKPKELHMNLEHRRHATTEEYYLDLLNHYSRGKCSPNIEELLTEMENDGVQLSDKLQEAISTCLSKFGLHKDLLSVIERLKKSGLEICGSMYEGLVHSYAISGDEDKALEECERMFQDNDSVQKRLRISLLRGVIRTGNSVLVSDKLEELVMTSHTFSFDEICSVFEDIVDRQQIDLIPVVLTYLNDEFLIENLPSLVTKFIGDKNVEFALNMVQNFYNTKVQLNTHRAPVIYKEFITTLIRENHPLDDIIKKCRELRKFPGCHYIMEYLLFEYLLRNKFSESLEIIFAFREMNVPVEPHYFWPLLLAARDKFKVEGICVLIKMMFLAGALPNRETLMNYVFPYLDTTNTYKYFKTFTPSIKFLRYFQEMFVLYALKNGCYEDCINLLTKSPLDRKLNFSFMEDYFMMAFTKGNLSDDLIKIWNFTKGIDLYEVISKLWSMGEGKRLEKVVQLMVSHGATGRNKNALNPVLGDTTLSNEVKAGIQTLLNLNVQQKINEENLREEAMNECMNLVEDLEIHMVELKAKQMNPVGQIFRLLKYYMKIGSYKKALTMKKKLYEFGGTGIEFSPAYLACMTRLAAFENKPEEGLEYYRRLRSHYPNFIIDLRKIEHVFSIVLQCGSDEELVDLMETVPEWRSDPAIIEDKIVPILRLAATFGGPKKTNFIYEEFIKKRVIRPTKRTLVCFVEAQLQLGNLDEAVKEYMRLMHEYKVAPLSKRLLKELVKSKRFKTMEDLVKDIFNYSNRFGIYYMLLRLLATEGDVKLLQHYFHKFKIPVMGETFLQVLGWENFRDEYSIRMLVFKTFILNVKESKEAVNFYVTLALEHTSLEIDEVEAEKFRDFLSEHQLLENDYEKKLNNIIELGKAVRKAMDRYG